MERLGLYNEHCTDCALHLTCKKVCFAGQGNTKAKLMVVLETPSYFDEENNTVAGADKDRHLKGVFEQGLKIDHAQIYFTHLVKCRPADGRPATAKEANDCLHYLEAEIQAIRPNAILAVGTTVAQVLTKQSGTITSLRDNTYDVEIGGVPLKVVCTFSPAYVERNETQLMNFAKDLHRAYTTANGVVATEKKKTQIVIADTFDKIKELVKHIKSTSICSFDTETTGLDWHLGHDFFKATCIGFSFQIGSSWVVPLEHFESPFNSVEQTKKILAYLEKHVFSNPEIQKIAHNVKFDMHVLRTYGVQHFKGRVDDTMVMHHILNELDRHGLKELASTFHPEFDGYDTGVKHEYATVSFNPLAEYCGIDNDLVMRLYVHFENSLMQDPRLYRLYRNLSTTFIRASFEAEHHGMFVDRGFMEAAIIEARQIVAQVTERLYKHPTVLRFEAAERQRVETQAIENLRSKIQLSKEKRKQEAAKKAEAWEAELQTCDDKRAQKIAKDVQSLNLKLGNDTAQETKWKEQILQIQSGQSLTYDRINFGSPVQLERLLYTKEGFGFICPESEKTAKHVLAALNDKTSFVEDLALLRSLEKTISTYLVGISDKLDADNKVHTSFLLHGTTTGRLAAKSPNLQNLPDANRVKNEQAKKVTSYVKQSFIAPEGHYIVQMDYSQAELRVIAEFADEKVMIKAYNEDKDLHAVTAAKLTGCKDVEEFYAKLSPADQKVARNKAKPANFGLLYGMQPEGYMEYAKNNYGVVLTLPQAKKDRDAFFSLYPNLLRYHAEYQRKARKFGQVRTLFGRCRRLPDIKSSNPSKQAAAEREAINSPIQGTAGEFTLFCVNMIYLRYGHKIRFVNTIHDSIIFYVPKEIMKEAVAIMKETAENLPTLQYFGKELTKVSMKVDVEYSDKCWKDMKPYEPEK